MTQQKNSSLSPSKDGLDITPHLPGRPMYEVRDEWGQRVCHCGTQADADKKVMENPGYTWDMFFWPPTPPNPVININARRLAEEKQLPPSPWDVLELD